jgi:hypothetical protein
LKEEFLEILIKGAVQLTSKTRLFGINWLEIIRIKMTGIN